MCGKRLTGRDFYEDYRSSSQSSSRRSHINPEVQSVPTCILWPDRDRQWEAVSPRLLSELPELLVLGDYDPEKRIGPAIWLRCVIARKDEGVVFPRLLTYHLSTGCQSPGSARGGKLSGTTQANRGTSISRVIWSQINAKDWTILALLKSDQGGLGMDVAQDNDARRAMQLALYRFLDEDIELLKGKRLDKGYFNTLLTGGDPVRDLLQWLDQGEVFKAGRGKMSGRPLLRSANLSLLSIPKLTVSWLEHQDWHPGKAHGSLSGKGFVKLQNTIQIFRNRFANVKCPRAKLYSNVDSHGGWPQWNDMQESGGWRQEPRSF